jgi:septal ring-binding cell division protein DamX
MKLEIHIPELAEFNTNVRQLIDTLNDLAVVGINSVKRAPAPAIEEAPTPVAEVEPEKPKRTRKAKAEEPAPDGGTGAEIMTYAVAEPQVEQEAAPAAVEPEPEQNVESEPEPENAPNDLTLADCTALSPKLQSSGKLDEAKAWLKGHGADRLKDLDPSHYGAFITFTKGLLG